MSDVPTLIAAHRHVGDPTGDAAAAPTATLAGGAGTLLASTRYYYRVAHVSPTGVEQRASDPVTLDTPAKAPPPPAPGLVAVAGGSLAAGQHFYVLSTYTDDEDHESAATNVGGVEIPFSLTSRTVSITLPALPPGASGFNVYVRRPSGVAYGWLAAIDMTGTPPTTFTDDGSEAPDFGRPQPKRSSIPPTAAAFITAVGVPTGWGWRLYRSADPARWIDSRVATVAAGTGTFTDTGAATNPGTPLGDAEVLTGVPSRIQLTDGAEVDGRLPSGNLSHTALEVQFQFPGEFSTGGARQLYRSTYRYCSIAGVDLWLGRDSLATDDDVIIDVKVSETGEEGTWYSVWDSDADRPRIAAGQRAGYNTASPALPYIPQGWFVTVDVDQVGGGSPRTDAYLTVSLGLLCQSTRSTSVQWPTEEPGDYELPGSPSFDTDPDLMDEWGGGGGAPSGPVNLLGNDDDASFETSLGGWHVIGTTGAISRLPDFIAPHGSFSMQVVAASTSTAAEVQSSTGLDGAPVTPGDAITARCTINNPGGSGTNYASLWVAFFDATGAYLSQTALGPILYNIPGTHTLASTLVSVPAGAAFAAMSVWIHSDSTSVGFRVDACSIHVGTSTDFPGLPSAA